MRTSFTEVSYDYKAEEHYESPLEICSFPSIEFFHFHDSFVTLADPHKLQTGLSFNSTNRIMQLPHTTSVLCTCGTDFFLVFFGIKWLRYHLLGFHHRSGGCTYNSISVGLLFPHSKP